MFKKIFYWTGLDSMRKEVNGKIKANNINHAKFLLIKQNITRIQLENSSGFYFLKKRKPLTTLDIAVFFRQFSTLIQAGVSIIQCCHILYQTQEKNKMKEMINKIKKDIEEGKNISFALASFPNDFDSFICHLIQISEKTGTFDTMLQYIASHKEKTLVFKNKIKKALFYPSIISMITLAISLIMLIWIVPQFESLYNPMTKSLPTITLTIIHFSKWMRHGGWLILSLIFFIFFLLYHFNFTPKVERILLTIPFIKKLYQKILLINFIYCLALAFSAGIAIMDALKMIAESNDSSIYRDAFLTLQIEISKGQQLHKAMQKNTLFPTLLVQMVRIGEETGLLDKMLKKMSDMYEADIDQLINSFSQLLEPLIIIILGVLIGGLVIAMYLPIFKLGNVL